MKNCFLICAAACMMTVCGVSHALTVNVVTLVKDGKANCAIVLPNKLTGYEKVAANDLKYYIGKMSGADVKVVSEKSFSGDLIPIYVGICEATKQAGINVDALQPEEYLIKATYEAVFLACNDIGNPRTIQYAVSDFLQKELWVRFLGGGDLWTHIPERKTIFIDPFERKYQPPFTVRGIRNDVRRLYSIDGAKLMNIDFESWKESHPIDSDWYVRMGCGSRIVQAFGHSFSGWWEKYGAANPEFFALQPNGTRTQSNERERLCVSNPALWDKVAEVRLAELKGKPEGSMVSICPNDGGYNHFCFCPECQKLDPPEGRKIYNVRFIDPKTGKPFPSYPSLTDRYLRFYNEVAKRIAKERPDAKVGAYAYSAYLDPPVRIKQVEPNLMLGIVTMKRDVIEGWGKLGVPMRHRPNFMGIQNDAGLPRNSARYLADFTRFCFSQGVYGFDHDSSSNMFDSQGLEYYILCRMMYDPKIDVDKEIKDYIERGFGRGKGAAAMERYFDKLEDIWNRVRTERKYTGNRKENPEELLMYFNEETIASLKKELNTAKEAIADKTSKEYRRVVLIENTVRYAETLRNAYELMKSAGGTPDSLTKASEMVYEFCREHASDESADYLLRAYLARGFLYYSRRNIITPFVPVDIGVRDDE
ncbi:MAG: DUF4838 domain-containing protein [Planctomycetaceae bacterium]|nr:DUF4838 domain-containing protein [Planctomycetaceae bacterium]